MFLFYTKETIPVMIWDFWEQRFRSHEVEIHGNQFLKKTSNMQILMKSENGLEDLRSEAMFRCNDYEKRVMNERQEGNLNAEIYPFGNYYFEIFHTKKTIYCSIHKKIYNV
jgi:hypothetical protein